ncbi:MAG: methyltransferase domain-containing protein, partial [Betaproteobacteria bacterium]|nr:methyltransferase domain-containing protein [Betaproteobacteria bacterium]
MRRLWADCGGRRVRLDFERIAAAVERDSSVLDLGCGGGEMLEYLRAGRGVRGVGADIDADNLVRCFEKNVAAVYCDIRRGLSMFGDNAFDTVVLSDTMQTVPMPPQKLLAEMLRIGRSAVVSFPNFGHWRLRLQLLAGRAPVGRTLPREWYDTENVRYCTVRDFELLCRAERFPVRRR